MEKRALLNRIRSLFNIDGDLLPELTPKQQSKFLSDPVGFFLHANEVQSDAIMRQVESRQRGVETNAVAELSQAKNQKIIPVVKSAGRSKKRQPQANGQRELLLPISGGKATADAKKQEAKPIARPKAS